MVLSWYIFRFLSTSFLVKLVLFYFVNQWFVFFIFLMVHWLVGGWNVGDYVYAVLVISVLFSRIICECPFWKRQTVSCFYNYRVLNPEKVKTKENFNLCSWKLKLLSQSFRIFENMCTFSVVF